MFDSDVPETPRATGLANTVGFSQVTKHLLTISTPSSMVPLESPRETDAATTTTTTAFAFTSTVTNNGGVAETPSIIDGAGTSAATRSRKKEGRDATKSPAKRRRPKKPPAVASSMKKAQMIRQKTFAQRPSNNEAKYLQFDMLSSGCVLGEVVCLCVRESVCVCVCDMCMYTCMWVHIHAYTKYSALDVTRMLNCCAYPTMGPLYRFAKFF